VTPVLSIRDLSVRLPEGADRPFAVRNLSLDLFRDEVLCVVGESGSGKSVTAASILRLLPPQLRVAGGSILFGERDIVQLPMTELHAIRGARIGMIFQDPMSALNPLQRIGVQIAETFRVHPSLRPADIKARVIELLDQMRLPNPAEIAEAYPHELSGGQRQRAMIAMALALEPDILIADEPTTALDVTTQAQILTLIRELQQRTRMAVLFITHDLGVVADIGTRIVVMKSGEMVEQGKAREVLTRPQSAYTRDLIAAIPTMKPKAVPPEPAGAPALVARGLNKIYRRRGRRTIALQDVSIELARGSTLGVVGESGSGKSTLARCLVRLLAPDSGSVTIGGQEILGLSRRQWRREVGRIQMVFQDPYASLNPRRRVGEIVTQGAVIHGLPAKAADQKARTLFGLVGLDPDAVTRFPHEFSGGQRQRIALARALALDPEILVADEPVSALDVSVQAQVLTLLADLKRSLGLSIVFITHDLRVAAQICDQVAIMQGGKIVEYGPAATVLTAPQHAYSKALLAAVPGRATGSSA
jgi:peptide/nickel transport system ATP-binding protein